MTKPRLASKAVRFALLRSASHGHGIPNTCSWWPTPGHAGFLLRPQPPPPCRGGVSFAVAIPRYTASPICYNNRLRSRSAVGILPFGVPHERPALQVCLVPRFIRRSLVQVARTHRSVHRRQPAAMHGASAIPQHLLATVRTRNTRRSQLPRQLLASSTLARSL